MNASSCVLENGFHSVKFGIFIGRVDPEFHKALSFYPRSVGAGDYLFESYNYPGYYLAVDLNVNPNG